MRIARPRLVRVRSLRWKLAKNLAALSRELSGHRHQDEARRCGDEALAILAEFDDPKSVALRRRLAQGRL